MLRVLLLCFILSYFYDSGQATRLHHPNGDVAGTCPETGNLCDKPIPMLKQEDYSICESDLNCKSTQRCCMDSCFGHSVCKEATYDRDGRSEEPVKSKQIDMDEEISPKPQTETIITPDKVQQTSEEMRKPDSEEQSENLSQTETTDDVSNDYSDFYFPGLLHLETTTIVASEEENIVDKAPERSGRESRELHDYSDESELLASDESKWLASDEFKSLGSDESELLASDESELPSSDESELPSSDESKLPSSDESEWLASDEFKSLGSDESELLASDESELPSSDESELPSSDESELSSSDESELPSSDEFKLLGSDKSKLLASDESELPSSDESKLLTSDESKLLASDEFKWLGSYETEFFTSDESEFLTSDESELLASNEISHESNWMKSREIEFTSEEKSVESSEKVYPVNFQFSGHGKIKFVDDAPSALKDSDEIYSGSGEGSGDEFGYKTRPDEEKNKSTCVEGSDDEDLDCEGSGDSLESKIWKEYKERIEKELAEMFSINHQDSSNEGNVKKQCVEGSDDEDLTCSGSGDHSGDQPLVEESGSGEIPHTDFDIGMKLTGMRNSPEVSKPENNYEHTTENLLDKITSHDHRHHHENHHKKNEETTTFSNEQEETQHYHHLNNHETLAKFPEGINTNLIDENPTLEDLTEILDHKHVDDDSLMDNEILPDTREKKVLTGNYRRRSTKLDHKKPISKHHSKLSFGNPFHKRSVRHKSPLSKREIPHQNHHHLHTKAKPTIPFTASLEKTFAYNTITDNNLQGDIFNGTLKKNSHILLPNKKHPKTSETHRIKYRKKRDITQDEKHKSEQGILTHLQEPDDEKNLDDYREDEIFNDTFEIGKRKERNTKNKLDYKKRIGKHHPKKLGRIHKNNHRDKSEMNSRNEVEKGPKYHTKEKTFEDAINTNVIPKVFKRHVQTKLDYKKRLHKHRPKKFGRIQKKTHQNKHEIKSQNEVENRQQPQAESPDFHALKEAIEINKISSLIKRDAKTKLDYKKLTGDKHPQKHDRMYRRVYRGKREIQPQNEIEKEQENFSVVTKNLIKSTGTSDENHSEIPDLKLTKQKLIIDETVAEILHDNCTESDFVFSKDDDVN